MTKWLLPLLLLAGSLSFAQVTGPTTQPLNASDFGRWTVPSQTSVPVAGPAGVFLQFSQVTATAGPQFAPVALHTPILIIDTGRSEIVTPISVSCSVGDVSCSFVATFVNPHPGGFSIGSGTYGLQEAINYLLGTGGTVNITTGWPGTTAMITGATGSSTVSIQDMRNGLGLYTWSGSAYVLAVTVSTSTANVFALLNQFLMGILAGPVTFAQLSAIGAPPNGMQIYVSDAQQQNPCVGGGSGAMAVRVAGAWQCSSGAGGGSLSPTGVITPGDFAVWDSSSVLRDGGLPVTQCNTPLAMAYWTVTGKVVSCDTHILTDGNGNWSAVSATVGGFVLINNGVYDSTPNSATGTTTNSTVCMNSSRQGVTCPINTVIGVRGTALTGGTVGNASVCEYGSCPVIFDNVATAGHAVIPSSSVPGQMHDTGASSNVAGIQTFYVSNGGGTASPGAAGFMDIYPADQNTPSSTVSDQLRGSIAAGQIAFGANLNTIQGTNFATLDTAGMMQVVGLVGSGASSQLSFPNTNDATGTHSTKLVRIGAAGQIIETTTSDTAVLAYPVTSSVSQNGNVICAPGTTGNGCPAMAGHVTVLFDASGGTIHHFVGVSTTTAAVAKDLGATLPAGPICVIGELLSAASGSGTGVVDVHPFCYVGGTSPTSADTFQNKAITTTGAGGNNTITGTWEADIPFAVCTGTSTSVLLWDVLPSGTSATAAGCGGTNVNQGNAAFANAGTPALQLSFRLPQTLTGTADVYLTYQSAATASSFTPVVDAICNATNGSVTDDPAFSAGNFFAPGAQSTPGTTLFVQTVSATGISWPVSCTAGTMLHLRAKRTDAAGAATVNFITVHIVGRKTL